ncbi:MAG: BON domain-containing protein [Gemmatimonadaceae bacterium]|nr:BON domain-containing protein [Gemmatimonadaceae bacterium]
MRRITTAAIAIMLTAATACSNTAKGVEKDAENAGDKAAAATEKAADATASTAGNAGASMGAAMETADVKTALLADTRISATDINVDTNKDNKSVTLNGTVPTAEQKKLAEDVAKAKAPDYNVINNLTVKPAK